MAEDIVFEFVGKSERFKRELDSIERDARRTAVAISRSFRDAANSGFGVDQRVARQQMLATDRDINQRMLADRQASDRKWVDSSIAEQNRLANRTRIYTERRRDEWEQAEERRARATGKARQVTGQALTAAAAALRIGISLAQQYADKWEYAGSIMDRTNRSIARLKDGIGRDLVLAFDALSPAVDTLERARSGVVNLLASIATLNVDQGRKIDGELNRTEGLERNRIQTDTFRQEQLQQLAGGDGPDAARARAELEKRAYAERINALAAEGRISGSQASDLVAGFRPGGSADDGSAARQSDIDRRSRVETARRDAETRSAATFGDTSAGRISSLQIRADFEASGLDPSLSQRERQEAQRSIYAERDQAISREIEKERERLELEKERRAEALESYGIRDREARIDDLIGQGKRREGEILREQLRMEREIADIKRDQRITDEDRAGLIEQARRRAGARIERLRDETTTGPVRSLGSGLVTALTRQTVLGGGQSIESIATAQLDESRKQTNLLAQIAEKEGGGVL